MASHTTPNSSQVTDGAFLLTALQPFSLERTVAALRRRPSSLTDILEDGEYRRVITLGGCPRPLAVRQCGETMVHVRGLDGPLTESERDEAAAALDRMLGLSFDLSPIQAAVRSDERLARIMAQVPGMKPPRFDSLWTAFLCVVPFQQVSLDSGIAVLNRLVSQLGPLCEWDGRACYGFPSAERIATTDPEVLRRCGLSQAKVRTLMGAAERIVSGELTEQAIEHLDDADAVQMLTRLPGIGPWSAHIILLRGFRRLSIFPAGDSGASGTLAKLLRLDPARAETESHAIAATLGPWKGYLYFLLLAWRLLQSGILTPA